MPWPKGVKRPEETRNKISATSKGRKMSVEARVNMSKAQKGRVVSEQARRNMSIASKNRKRCPLSEETKQKIKEARARQISPRPKGFKMSLEQKRKIGLANSGENSPNWKGGITSIHYAIRNSARYKEWRQAVFERDKFTCVDCGQLRGRIEADHIKRFADYPELRFELSNGRTLCYDCHRKTPTYGRWNKEVKVSV